MTISTFFRMMLVLFAVALIGLQAGAAAYTITDLGSFGIGYTFPTAINNCGQVVGGSFVDLQTEHPFLYSDGVFHDLGTLGGANALATAINDHGDIVGYSAIASAPYSSAHAFLYSGGVMNDLGTNGNYTSEATGINKHGQIVGNYGQYSFIYQNGQFQSLGTEHLLQTKVTGINNHGEAVGYFYGDNFPSNDGYHAFTYLNGTFTDIGKLGGSVWGLAYAINDAGQVAGTAWGNGGFIEGASLYAAGISQVFGGSIARGVNNSGVVVGQTLQGPSQGDHAFVYQDGHYQDLNSLIDP